MATPTAIAQIETRLGLTLRLAPAHGHDPVRNVMACRTDPHRENKWQLQYALHPDGALAGLNLAGLGLHHEDWQNIAWLLDLSRLEALNLRGNALDAMAELENMPNLRYLDLCNNQLTEFTLPEGLDRLEHLWLDGNENLSSPPPEIVRQGRFALCNYFKALAEQGSEIVYEAKMLILGDAGAGKTTLARKVGDPDADLPDAVKDSTPGIMVSSLLLKEMSPAFTIHIWDFGGQEVYHATHQFFLTKKSLYVLLCDGRKEEQFDYWLQMQEIYGQDSRLLMVVNQKGDMQPNLPMSDLRRDYPNVSEGKPTVINLATDRSGAVALRQHIERSIRNLPQFERGERVPKKWVAIRRQLEGIKADLNEVWNCAEYEDYFEELLRLMERFELCYEAPERKGLFIVPSLLPDESPNGYTWEEPNGLQIQYQYTFMPKDIMARLIVRQHGLLESPPVMWKRGAVFSDNGARIEAMESYRDKCISLRSNGNGRNAKELMTAISREIDALNRSFHFNERMKVAQKIPCNCPVCKDLPIPHYFLRSNLDKADRANQPVQCQESFQMISVRVLLDGVFANEVGAKPLPIDQDTIVEWLELGELQKALEALRSEFPEVSIQLSNLKDAEKAYSQKRIEFEELSGIKARLKFAVLELLGSKQ